MKTAFASKLLTPEVKNGCVFETHFLLGLFMNVGTPKTFSIVILNNANIHWQLVINVKYQFTIENLQAERA